LNKISIIIPVFNKFNFTKSCIEDLSHLNTEIIIVDNASSDETSSLENNNNIIYHRNNENLGFGKACNIGYSLATSNNILFLNNDIRVKSNHSDWISLFQPAIDKGYLVGPTMGQLDNNLNFLHEKNTLLDKNSYISGWCLAGSKDTFDKLKINGPGPFDEDFFVYFEDTDLSFRARNQKIKFEVIDIPVVHFGKMSSKQFNNTYQLYSDARKIFLKKWKK